jgi:hypothetical protein
VVDRSVDLLGGRMLAAAAELAQNHEALRSDALAARVEQLDQVVLILDSMACGGVYVVHRACPMGSIRRMTGLLCSPH